MQRSSCSFLEINRKPDSSQTRCTTIIKIGRHCCSGRPTVRTWRTGRIPGVTRFTGKVNLAWNWNTMALTLLLLLLRGKHPHFGFIISTISWIYMLIQFFSLVDLLINNKIMMTDQGLWWGVDLLGAVESVWMHAVRSCRSRAISTWSPMLSPSHSLSKKDILSCF